MSKYIGVEIRRLVIERSGHRCEYCLIHEEYTFFGCQVDHIISRKHGGNNDPENLAYACIYCNRNKGTDLGSILPHTGKLTRFFNPRKDRWNKHFHLSDVIIEPLSGIGEVTVHLLDLNNHERLLEREALIAIEAYPAPNPKKQTNQ